MPVLEVMFPYTNFVVVVVAVVVVLFGESDSIRVPLCPF